MRDSGIVAAVTVAALILPGCAEPPPIPVGIHSIGEDAQFGDRDSNQTHQSGCTQMSAVKSRVQGTQIGKCFDMHGTDNKIGMSPGHCLVRDDEPRHSFRFHVVDCQDAGPRSCETDLGKGNIAEYMSPCSGND